MKNDCLEIDMLSAYLEKRLSRDERDRVEAHLADCEACLEEVATATAALAEADRMRNTPAPMAAAQAALKTIGERIGQTAARLIEWVEGLAPPVWMRTYALQPVRSSAAGCAGSVLVRKQLNGLVMEMFVQKDSPEKVSMWVNVFDRKNSAKNVCLTLFRRGGSPQARFLNRDYEMFEKLSFGEYKLVVEQNTHQKGCYTFQVDAEGFYER